MLFRLRMNCDECLDSYHDLAKKIFAPTFLGSKLLGKLFKKPVLFLNALFLGFEFQGGPLETAAKGIVDKYSHNLGPTDKRYKYQLVHPESGMM